MNKKNKKLNKFILLGLVAFIGCYSGDMPESDDEQLSLDYDLREYDLEVQILPMFDAERFDDLTSLIEPQELEWPEGLEESAAKKSRLDVGSQYEYKCDPPECDNEHAMSQERVSNTVHSRKVTNKSDSSKHVMPIDKKKLHKCDWYGCDKTFKHMGHLNLHMLMHAKEKPHTCDWSDCGKAFTHKCNLDIHMLTHTKEKPHVCDWPDCGKAFAQRCTLNTHRLIHTGERPYKCDKLGCDKAFAKKSHLKDHILAHTKEKPHKCDKSGCNKAFTQKSNLNRHMLSCKGNLATEKDRETHGRKRDHMGEHSEGSEAEGFRCMMCSFTCETGEEMQTHRETCK